MNQRQKKFKEYRLLQKLDYKSRCGNKEGYVKIYPNNSFEHEKTKFEVAYYLKKQGFKIYTEGEFSRGGRGDIIAIKDGEGYIIEILHSEDEKKFHNKELIYPTEFKIYKVYTKNFSIDSFKF